MANVVRKDLEFPSSLFFKREREREKTKRVDNYKVASQSEIIRGRAWSAPIRNNQFPTRHATRAIRTNIAQYIILCCTRFFKCVHVRCWLDAGRLR